MSRVLVLSHERHSLGRPEADGKLYVEDVPRFISSFKIGWSCSDIWTDGYEAAMSAIDSLNFSIASRRFNKRNSDLDFRKRSQRVDVLVNFPASHIHPLREVPSKR